MDSSNRVDTGAGFKRIRHWIEAGLIGLLILTGFEIHGMLSVFGFEIAHNIHKFVFLSILVLTPIIILGFFITNKRKRSSHAHNYSRVIHKPIYRKIYLLIGLAIILIQAISGMLYFSYNYWSSSSLLLSIRDVAYVHTAGAFVIAAYMIIHIYLKHFYPKLSQRRSE